MGSEMKEIFEDIIKNNRWKKHPCGPGSTIQYTQHLRSHLGNLLTEHNITSMIDAPCGDYSWMSITDLPSIKTYVGGDIVEFLIEKNKLQYANVDFKILDLTSDKLPDVDLLFCRDCLLHLSFEDINKVFANISNSNIKYVLMSNWFEDSENQKDIKTGQARYINFLESPFNFKNPIGSIVDYVEGFPRREMVLWPKTVIDDYIKGKK
jgi:hypothetical protein